ncbi:MAG: uroporphyrinogen-III C-methyltransferase, partial [Dokdonella sp.]
RSVREELLGAAERARALEDAVANMADQRLTSRDAMALNEAEFVLQLAGQRLSLFNDPAAAIAAYRLADSALAAAEDPLFGSVRQTIAAEIQALVASQPLQTQATLAALASLRTQVATLPVRPNSAVKANTEIDATSRFARVFGQFVRISRDDTASTLVARDSGLARSLAALDLRAAEAALFARNSATFAQALAAARGEIAAAFDPDAEPVRAALAEIDRLATQSMAPQLPELGSALRELRNLRTTRALARDVVEPVQDEALP